MEVRTLSDRVYDIIRDRILSGELGRGEPIRQDAIAADLGISKIPLREALTRLERDGLVTSQVHRGYVVSLPTAAEAEEVFLLRLKLEPDATVAGSRCADQADWSSTQALLEACNVASDMQQCAFNRLFHVSLARPGAGRLTLSLIEHINIIADRYVRLHLMPEGRNDRAAGEHTEIFTAWRARDLRRLRRLATDHIEGTIEDLRQQLP